MEPINLTDSNFKQEVLDSTIPVLVDFWAVWCGPCKSIAPTITELAKELNGKVKVAKLDVDNNQQSGMNYGIRSIPTLLIFNNGKVVNQMVGLQSKDQILKNLQSYL
ncbi:MAG: thioredoxin [Bacteroidota bacterium]